MNKNVKLKGRLALFYNWPIILIIILAVLNLGLYVYDAKSGFFLSGILLIGGVATAVVYTLNGHYIIQEIVGFAAQYSTVQKKLINEMEIPYVLLDSSGKVMWANVSHCSESFSWCHVARKRKQLKVRAKCFNS